MMITHAKGLWQSLLYAVLLLMAACGGSPTGEGGAGFTGASPTAAAVNFDLFMNGRGAPLKIADMLAAADAGEGASLTAISFPAITDQGGTLVLDTQGEDDFQQHIIRYSPAANAAATDTFSYNITNSNGLQDSASVTVNLTPPEACNASIEKRKASGLGWCYETYLDSFDTGADGDGTGTNIALQVFIPHPWHQRQNALASGASLSDSESGYSPLLIHSHGFGGNKEEDFQNPETFLDNQLAKSAWEDGYNVISYTQRGFGGTPLNGGDSIASGDSIGVLAPNLEGLDFIRVVDWAICHLREDAPLELASAEQNHEVDVNNCATDFNGAGSWGASLLSADGGARLAGYDDDVALATVGYSYGGGFQFLAQSVDTRVDAIMPMGTWHDLRFSLHPNDTPKYTWTTIMTTFASTAPGLGGGNGEPLPTVLTDGNVEMSPVPRPIGGNTQANDNPHNKDRQVSVKNARLLGPKGPVAWCNGAQDYYATKYGDADPDQDPESLQAANPANTPSHLTVSKRGPRANLFVIQGYGDTLFNYNEGYDNARCFEDAGIADVRMLQQTSGHPFPTDENLPAGLIPPHYAGQNTSMYLDEIVHCGVDSNGDPIRYNMVEVLQQWMDFHLRGGLLPVDLNHADEIFPKVCITQTNVDPDLTLQESDPFYNGTNSGVTGFKWSREGAVFDSVANSPVGHSHYSTPDASQVNADGNFEFSGLSVLTDPATGLLLPTTDQPLYVASRLEGEVMSGIPLVHLELTRPLLTPDPIVYVGVYVKRCQLNSANTTFNGDGTPNNCNAGNPSELLHFQMTSIRPFEATATSLLNDIPPTPDSAVFPRIDPRNFVGNGTLGPYYPYIAGDNPAVMRNGTDIVNNSNLQNPQGRILGVSSRLYPGDEVGLAFSGAAAAFVTVGSLVPGPVTISGTVQLPLVDTSSRTDAPGNVPAYVDNAGG